MIILLFFVERSLWISSLFPTVITIRIKSSSTSPETSEVHSQAWKMQKRSWFLFHGKWNILAQCWEAKLYTHFDSFSQSYLTWLLDSFNLTYHIYRFLNDLVNVLIPSVQNIYFLWEGLTQFSYVNFFKYSLSLPHSKWYLFSYIHVNIYKYYYENDC